MVSDYIYLEANESTLAEYAPDGTMQNKPSGLTGEAATSPNVEVFAYAAAQVKKAMEVAHELGAEGYVFWGGREGYSTLWNTDMKRELEKMAKFLHMEALHFPLRDKSAFHIVYVEQRNSHPQSQNN